MRARAPAKKPAKRNATQEAGRLRVLAARDYESFRKRLRAFPCRICPLHRGRTHIVVDRGTPGAPILLIGEGPGAEEDRQGLAFVGRSGRLLDELLLQAGVDPENGILIANVVKCRPPANRAPSAAEAMACLPYLRRQIELARPAVAVLLGRTALRFLMPELARKPLEDVAGKLFPGEGLGVGRVLVTYHPAFALRTPAVRKQVVSHLRKAARAARRFIEGRAK